MVLHFWSMDDYSLKVKYNLEEELELNNNNDIKAIIPFKHSYFLVITTDKCYVFEMNENHKVVKKDEVTLNENTKVYLLNLYDDDNIYRFLEIDSDNNVNVVEKQLN
jgi:hypothetical protein